MDTGRGRRESKICSDRNLPTRLPGQPGLRQSLAGQVRAGLRTYEQVDLRRFPTSHGFPVRLGTSARMWVSFSFTAAGQLRIRTGFPFKPPRTRPGSTNTPANLQQPTGLVNPGSADLLKGEPAQRRAFGRGGAATRAGLEEALYSSVQGSATFHRAKPVDHQSPPKWDSIKCPPKTLRRATSRPPLGL